MLTFPRHLAFALLATVLAGAAANGTVLEDRSIAELIARADRVDVAVVLDQRYLDGGELGLTETRLQVERTLKGGALRTLVVSQLGGERDGVATELVGDAQLRPGDRLLLLTYASPDGRRWLVSMGLGAWSLSGAHARVQLDAALVSPVGQLLPGPHVRTTTLVDVERLVELERSIEAERAKEAEPRVEVTP